jgi:hypothetical protein
VALLRNASGFAEAYLANGRKASDAARTIGVTGSAGSIAVKANRLLKQARESGLLEKRLEEIAAAMGVDEVLERLSVITRASGENSPDKETEENHVAGE